MPRKSIAKGKNRGIRYEERINKILKDNGLQLTSTPSGGASDAPDGYFWYKENRYPLEIKRRNADFAQVELNWIKNQGFFYSKRSKNLDFVDFISNESNFLEKINQKWRKSPRKYTASKLNKDDREWDLDNFKDVKELINVSYIEAFYNSKNPPINYIQIQDRGFFYLGTDIAKLAVPRLNGNPYLRARVKTRSITKNKWGFLVAIKMPGIITSTHDIEKLNNRKFPIPEGVHFRGHLDEYI